MVSCAACGCTKTPKNTALGITFHSFPKDPYRRKTWVDFIKKPEWQPKSNSMLCSQHFTSDCFDRTSKLKTQLHPTSIPNIEIDRLKYVRNYNPISARIIQDLKNVELKEQTEPSVEKKEICALSEVKEELRALQSVELTEQTETSVGKKEIYILGEVKKELEALESVVEIKEEPMEELELEAISAIYPEKPLGELREQTEASIEKNIYIVDEANKELQALESVDVFLRVCRTCLRIMKIEETVPLVDKTKLYKRLASILQFDLLTVKHCCLCKDCERFINAVCEFRLTCKVNEGTLREFDWENKTKDLLHVVDQDDLRTIYDDIKGISDSSTSTVENKSSLIVENICGEVGKQLEEKENGLSDLEDYRYNKDKQQKIDHDYTEKTSLFNSASNCLLIGKDDIFSPAFDKYFETLGDQANFHVKVNCRKSEGKWPFLCEFCGKMIQSRASIYRHKKLHYSVDRFWCDKCHEDFYEWSSYISHCKSEHKRFPKSFKWCPYHSKKKLNSHKKIRHVENLKYTCVDCKLVFKKKINFEKHRTLHRASEVLCGLRVRRTALRARNVHLSVIYVKSVTSAKDLLAYM